MALKRVQFDFSEAEVERIDALVARIDASARPEVLKRALALLAFQTELEARGAVTSFVYPDGHEVKLVFVR